MLHVAFLATLLLCCLLHEFPPHPVYLKEVSSITLRSASATMARGMGTGSFTEVYETLHEFVQLQASIQKKLQVLDGRAGEESGTIGTLQQDASRLQSKAAAIQRMLQASITDSRSAIAELSNEC
eukprot:m.53638 g.53638  ORF g.53638 m.53638 type:complete len:125 (+) comp11374_c1_seq2:3295-3669(+)